MRGSFSTRTANAAPTALATASSMLKRYFFENPSTTSTAVITPREVHTPSRRACPGSFPSASNARVRSRAPVYVKKAWPTLSAPPAYVFWPNHPSSTVWNDPVKPSSHQLFMP